MTRYLIAILSSVVLLVTGSADRLAGQELRYAWQPGQQLVYETEITVDAGQSIHTFKGVTRYKVESVNGEQIRLTYSGGLPESVRAKESTNRGGPPFGPRFGPPGFGPPGFGGPPGFPFGRTNFAGRAITTNRLTITPRGSVLTLEGESQLPYLLGNVSLMPFEMLPERKQKDWTIDSGVSITEGDDDRRPPFGRFGPFSQSNQTVQAGSETTKFEITSEDNKQVVAKKTYKLSTPKTADQPAFEMSGSGTWVFDRTQNASKSLDFSQKLIVREDNVDVTFPITMKYRLLTTTEIAKLDEEAKKRQEEHERKVAEEKRKAEAPLTPEEKQAALAALQSGSSAQMLETLKQLSAKSPKDPDPDVIAALRPLLKDSDKRIQENAEKALASWSPDFKAKLEINKAYNSHMPVKATNRPVTDTTPLYVGQIVQVLVHRIVWHAAEILSFQPDGQVVVRTRGIGARELTVPRRDLQLAPEEVDQPPRPATAPVPASAIATSAPLTAEPRVWTDSTGEHKIEATFLELADGKVKIRRTDGREVAVPLDRLSAADQAYAEKAQQAKKKRSDNPFEPKENPFN